MPPSAPQYSSVATAGCQYINGNWVCPPGGRRSAHSVTAETPVSNEALVVALSAGGALVVLVALMASWTVALKHTVNKRVAAAVARN